MMSSGWKEVAKTEKALARNRYISTSKELLRLNFLYRTSENSYDLTSALTKISENQTEL